MILNNIKALIGHIFTIGITVLLLKVFSYFYAHNVSLNNILFKLIVSIIILFCYFLIGKLMRLRKRPITDFMYGFFIIIFAILFFMIAKIGTGNQIFNVPIGAEISKFLLDLFMAPMFLIINIFNIKMNFYIFIICLIVPGLIMGFGAATKRKNILAKRRERQRRIYEQMKSGGKTFDNKQNYRNK